MFVGKLKGKKSVLRYQCTSVSRANGVKINQQTSWDKEETLAFIHLIYILGSSEESLNPVSTSWSPDGDRSSCCAY